jgi:hypothetical protein
MVGLFTQRLLRSLELAGAGTDTETPQQSYVEVGIDPSAEVSARRRDTPLPL